MEIEVIIKCKFRNVDYLLKVLNKAVNQFLISKNNDSFIIAPDPFEESKSF